MLVYCWLSGQHHHHACCSVLHTGLAVTEGDVQAILNWGAGASGEVPFKPARVIMQDMSGGPCLMDLEAMQVPKSMDLLMLLKTKRVRALGVSTATCQFQH